MAWFVGATVTMWVLGIVGGHPVMGLAVGALLGVAPTVLKAVDAILGMVVPVCVVAGGVALLALTARQTSGR
jgi:hypothetical protein